MAHFRQDKGQLLVRLKSGRNAYSMEFTDDIFSLNKREISEIDLRSIVRKLRDLMISSEIDLTACWSEFFTIVVSGFRLTHAKI